MTQTLREAQDYLTVIKGDTKKQILDIEPLLNRHPVQSIVWFLRVLYKEKKIKLQYLIEGDKKNQEINEIVVVMFRIRMAIRTMINEREVKAA